MGFHPDPWTPEREDELRRLWVLGTTYAAIATALGPDITRNAVASRCRRLGMKRTPLLHDVPKPKPTKASPVKPVACEPFKSRGIPLLQIGVMQCRYPLWGDQGCPEYLLCGNECGITEAYCEHHARICSGKGTQSERRAGRAPKAGAPESEAA